MKIAIIRATQEQIDELAASGIEIVSVVDIASSENTASEIVTQEPVITVSEIDPEVVTPEIEQEPTTSDQVESDPLPTFKSLGSMSIQQLGFENNIPAAYQSDVVQNKIIVSDFSQDDSTITLNVCNSILKVQNCNGADSEIGVYLYVKCADCANTTGFYFNVEKGDTESLVFGTMDFASVSQMFQPGAGD